MSWSNWDGKNFATTRAKTTLPTERPWQSRLPWRRMKLTNSPEWSLFPYSAERFAFPASFWLFLPLSHSKISIFYAIDLKKILFFSLYILNLLNLLDLLDFFTQLFTKVNVYFLIEMVTLSLLFYKGANRSFFASSWQTYYNYRLSETFTISVLTFKVIKVIFCSGILFYPKPFFLVPV